MESGATKVRIRLAACLIALLAPACGADAPSRNQPGPRAGVQAGARPPIESGILAEINRARADPPGYARDLRRYRTYYRGNIVWTPGNPVGLRTSEGAAAVDEAIRFLARQPPLPPLASATYLARAAADHVADQGPRGSQGHAGHDGSSPAERIQRRGGSAYGASGEVIAYGPDDAASVVRDLIIDDGVADRGHRTILFSPLFHFAGAACGRHAGYRIICVVDFSDREAAR